MSKEKNTKPTKNTKKPQAKQKTVDPTKALKAQLKTAQVKINNLSKKVNELEAENIKNINDFQEKAKGFAAKAQKEVSRLKEEINNKQVEDLKHNKKYGAQKMLESILDPIINIEIAVIAGKNNEAVKSYVIGFEMLLTQLENQLASFGVFKIMPKVGDQYDPKIMQAMSKDGKGTKITAVKKPGFKLHERVIKPAIVTIG